ncbi:metallophosphoesterase [Eubacteriales bacterium KG127]
MYKRNKLLAIVVVIAMIMTSSSIISFGESEGTTFDSLNVTKDNAIILYTNDVHGGVSSNVFYTGNDKSLGYAGLAALKEKAKRIAAGVLLVDNGDSIQGSVPNTMSEGKRSIELMKQVGYDILIPGNHEFDWGIDNFLKNIKGTNLNYICANFTHMDGKRAFDKPYDIRTFNISGKDYKVGFIGIDTPESISKGTPKYFQDKDGKFIYSFNAEKNEELYELIQQNINAAKDAGA